MSPAAKLQPTDGLRGARNEILFNQPAFARSVGGSQHLRQNVDRIVRQSESMYDTA